MDTHDSYPSNNLPARLARPDLPRLAADRTPAPEAPRSVSLRQIFRGLTRYWWQMLAMWMVASTALVTVIYLKVKPSYEAVALLMAEPPEGTIFGSASNHEASAFLETQVNLIKSSAVLSAAAMDPKAANVSFIRQSADPIIELRSSLDVSVQPGTYLIRVAMKSQSAEETAIIVNAVVNAYIRSNTSRSGGATKDRIAKLEEYNRDLEKQQRQFEELWRGLADQHANAQLPVPTTLMGPGEKGEKRAVDGQTHGVHSITAKEYEEKLAALRRITADLFDTEITVNHLESTPQTEDPRLAREQQVRQAMANDAELAELRKEIQNVQAKRAKVEQMTRRPNDPAVINFQKQERGLQARYDEQFKAKAEHYRTLAEANRAAPGQDRRGETLRKLAMLKDAKQQMEAELKQIEVLSHKEAGGAVDIFIAQQKFIDVRDLKQMVVRRLEDLKFSAKNGAKIEVADVATVPNRPSSNSRPKLILATPVGVLAALMSLFVMLEIRAGRVSHPDELSPRMKAEVFAVPPLPTLRSGQGGRARGDQVEEFTQRVDHLRVALCGETSDGVARCVLITSAAGGEGKTTLAAQLAGRCANAGLSTLLIDADLRRPRLGQLLDVPEGPGLADVLSGDAEVESALVVIGNAGGFHLLPAGTQAPDPSRLLRGRRLGELIGRLRQTFDIVIIDTPPVLPVPDALTLGEWADGAVLAVRRDASRVSLVERANRMLSAKGIPLLGVVINGVKTSEMGYGGYSGYMSYSSAHHDAYPEAAPANTPVPAPEI